jgi:hypothetical protein
MHQQLLTQTDRSSSSRVPRLGRQLRRQAKLSAKPCGRAVGAYVTVRRAATACPGGPSRGTPGRIGQYELLKTIIFLCFSVPLWFSSFSLAQQQIESKLPIAFNRFYDYTEMSDLLHKLVGTYPDILTIQSIGKSEQDRDLWLVTLNNPATGPDTEKPAMWIDGNVHGNEIQAGETVLYAIWYLAKSYGQVESLTKLMDRAALYFLVSQNPDGRQDWFDNATNPHDYRTGLRPTDDDHDGLLDEDGPEDLDGDGHIGTMLRFDPNGQMRRNRDDPRIIERVTEPGVKGELSFVGSEGLDNDGDGQINEDGPGEYDMNRNWPTDWQPDYIQFGAGDYPLDRPETRAIADFILAHPNIAAGQSYHNAGGMILRGPGAKYNESSYPRADIAVYDRLGRAGEEMLPFYRYMIIHSDLYIVHGGFVNWLAEGLGIVSFTNELWTDKRIMQQATARGPEDGEGFFGSRGMDPRARMRWQDRVLFGQTFTEHTEFDHPTLGKVLIGGNTKWASRIPPPFMLEEECHRNFAFTMFHADNMPMLSFNWIDVQPLGPPGSNLWQITVEVENSKIIPTRTAWTAQQKIGLPDTLTLTGDGLEVVASGRLADRFDKTLDPVDHRKHIIMNERGVPGEERATFRYIVTGPQGARATVRYQSQKASDLEQNVELTASRAAP